MLIYWSVPVIFGPYEAEASQWKNMPLKHLGNIFLQFFRNMRLPFGNKRRICLMLMKHTPPNWKHIKRSRNIAPWSSTSLMKKIRMTLNKYFKYRYIHVQQLLDLKYQNIVNMAFKSSKSAAYSSPFSRVEFITSERSEWSSY